MNLRLEKISGSSEYKYVSAIKAEVARLETVYDENVQCIHDYADKYLEISRGADYELMIDNAQNELFDSIKQLFFDCLERCVSVEGLEDIFGEYLQNFKMYL